MFAAATLPWDPALFHVPIWLYALIDVSKNSATSPAAAFWLRLKGYRILARRLKTHAGEIDLVAPLHGVWQRPEGAAGDWATQREAEVAAGWEKTLGRVQAVELPGGFKLLTGRDVESRSELRELLTDAMVWALAIVLAMATIGALVVRGLFQRTLANISATAGSIAAGDFRQRVRLTGRGDRTHPDVPLDARVHRAGQERGDGIHAERQRLPLDLDLFDRFGGRQLVHRGDGQQEEHDPEDAAASTSTRSTSPRASRRARRGCTSCSRA
mgnify:CR=1 FL=1